MIKFRELEHFEELKFELEYFECLTKKFWRILNKSIVFEIENKNELFCRYGELPSNLAYEAYRSEYLRCYSADLQKLIRLLRKSLKDIEKTVIMTPDYIIKNIDNMEDENKPLDGQLTLF